MIRTLLFASIIFLAYSAIDLEEIKFPDWPTYSFKTYSGLLSIAEDQR